MNRAAYRLALGSAQFGLDYGITNTTGKVSLTAIANILAAAQTAGVAVIDTAQAYGDSETQLGRALPPAARFRIVSKLPRFSGPPDLDAVVSGVRRSLAALGQDRLHALLLHRGLDACGSHGAEVRSTLWELRTRGLTTKVGVSVYSPDDLRRILDAFQPDLVQLPSNLIDHRFDSLLPELKAAGVEVHARSLFLQGLLLAPPDRLPPGFAAHDLWRRIDERATAAGCDRLVLCLAHGLRRAALDHLVVGVTSTAELAAIVASLEAAAAIDIDLADLASTDKTLIDPSQWNSQ